MKGCVRFYNQLNDFVPVASFRCILGTLGQLVSPYDSDWHAFLPVSTGISSIFVIYFSVTTLGQSSVNHALWNIGVKKIKFSHISVGKFLCKTLFFRALVATEVSASTARHDECFSFIDVTIIAARETHALSSEVDLSTDATHRGTVHAIAGHLQHKISLILSWRYFFKGFTWTLVSHRRPEGTPGMAPICSSGTTLNLSDTPATAPPLPQFLPPFSMEALAARTCSFLFFSCFFLCFESEWLHFEQNLKLLNKRQLAGFRKTRDFSETPAI